MSWRKREGAAAWIEEKKSWREIAGWFIGLLLLVSCFVGLLFYCFGEEEGEESEEELNC